MRTLIESSGDVQVCWKRQVLVESSGVVNKRLDLLVGKLKLRGMECQWLEYRRPDGLEGMSGQQLMATRFVQGGSCQIGVKQQQEMKEWEYCSMDGGTMHAA